MTEKNKKSNIDEELSRAETALGAADLLTEGFEPKTHEGALRLFSLHFVKNGSFPSDSSHTFSKLMKYREEADYNPSYTFTNEDFQKLRGETQGLTVRIAEYLAEKGYL